jgi:glycosyltransferase involved in cell wall biosynthesis
MPITMPQLFPEHETVSCLGYLTQVFRIADSVITSSQWNVSQIATLISTGVLPDLPVHAVGLGSTSLVAVSPRPPSIDLPARFVLSVGTFELKKNRRAIYQAYRLAAESDRLPPLLLAGQPGGVPDEGVHLLRRDPKLAGLVYVLTDVSDAQLCWLYRNCDYTIYGSLAEGWGVPIDESLSFGAPCLCSHAAAMPEVGGPAARYFDPQDPLALLVLMRQAMKPNELDRWREEIRGTYYRTTWTAVCQAIETEIADRR